jgi:phenylacetate-CoA ligase
MAHERKLKPPRRTAVRRIMVPAIAGLCPRGYVATCFGCLATLEQTQWLAREAVEQGRVEALRILLRHAGEASPYYRELFRRTGLEAEGVRRMDDLRALPPLTRAQVQEHWREMMTVVPETANVMRNATGGSSGQPVIFYHDLHELCWRNAAALRHDQWSGWRVGEKRALVWGATRDFTLHSGERRWIDRLLFPEALIDASQLDDEVMAQGLRRLERWQPRLMVGYANALYAFARFAAGRGHRLRPAGIIATAEVLTEGRRRFIEQTFGCPIYERYGAREFGLIASQCEQRAGLHVNAEKIYVEFDDSRTDEAGRAPILITDLANLVMPLIRYEIGDLGRPLHGVCQCGRGLPLMDRVEGRVTDFIVAASGRRVSGVAAATYLITNCPGVGQVQLVQQRQGQVVLRCVAGDGFDGAAQRRLVERGREFFGPGMEVALEQVESIPRGPTGKWRFSISTVDPDRSE